ncbi:hypothetical protein EKK58_12760 [Candidatus Dependentiae bacterium]|nr:MAG: hypothetical protein EKK58_12760 [Candidatus Dependentiae bacterium]
MAILSLKQIQQGLKDKRLSVVAERTGLSYPTLKSLSDGKDQNYTTETLKTVSNYLTGNLVEESL